MTPDTVTELTQDQLTALDLQERLRAMALLVIPATIVCGMAGISEGAYRARLKQGQLDPRYVHFGLRTIQVVPMVQVKEVFFPDGWDQEASEELAFGLANDSLIISEAGYCYRVLFAGFTAVDALRQVAMKHAYKHGRSDGTRHRSKK